MSRFFVSRPARASLVRALLLGLVVLVAEPIRHPAITIVRFPFTVVKACVGTLTTLPQLPTLKREHERLHAELMQRQLEVARLQEQLRQAQHVAALLSQYAAGHLRMVIKPRYPDQIYHASAGASLRICRAIHKLGNACLQDGTRTHGTRLQRHVQRAAGEAVIAQLVRSFAKRLDFSVGSRVAFRNRSVVAATDHFAFANHHRPDRDRKSVV